MTTLTNKENRLNPKKKFGYAIGQMTDSIGFNAFYFFFLFFLTDFAGIPPAAAGTISLIAIMWDAVTDPVVGYISDNLKSKYGRRRPLMIGAAIPYAVCAFLLFNNVNLGPNPKFIYFTAIAIIFWSCYKTYVIPFFALGAELTDDFNERTSLRSWASVFLNLAVMLASAAPPMIIAMTEEAGGTGSQGWNNVGIIFGVMILITATICWVCTKGGELKDRDIGAKIPVASDKPEEKDNIIKNFLEILKLKPTKLLAASVLAWSVVAALLSSGPVYLMSNNLGYSAERQSTFFVVMTLASIAWLPVITFCSAKFGKKAVYACALLISTICLAVFAVLNFPSFGVLLTFIVIWAFGNCTYWTLYYSMMYDISELDEFINDKRREGTISALMSFFQKLGSAVSMWLIGTLLQFAKYDGTAAVQPESATNMILYINTAIPAVFGVIAVICAFAYPLTGDRFNALMSALKAKRQGLEYTTEGFEKLL